MYNIDDIQNTILQGDVTDQLKLIPDESYVTGGCLVGNDSYDLFPCNDSYECQCGRRIRILSDYDEHFKMLNKIKITK